MSQGENLEGILGFRLVYEMSRLHLFWIHGPIGREVSHLEEQHRSRPEDHQASMGYVGTQKPTGELAHRRPLRLGGIRRVGVGSCRSDCKRQHPQQTQA
jgi:hypothetical protein